MNKLTFISQIELLGFKQERQLTWIKREIEKHQYWQVVFHARNDTFTLCLRDYEKCSHIPFPENETDLQTFFKIVMR